MTIRLSKTIVIDYLLIFFTVIISARSSFLYDKDYFLILLAGASGAVFYMRRRAIGPLIPFVVFYLVWISSLYVKFSIPFGEFANIYTYLGFFTLTFAAYFVVMSVNEFPKKFANVVAGLAAISLVLYPIQRIIPQTLFALMRIPGQLTGGFMQYSGDHAANILVYTIHTRHFHRNSGFSWEPGAFAFFLILALFCVLITNRNRIDRRFIIMVVAMLPTFSTTGYIGLLLVFGYWYINLKALSAKYFLIVLMIPGFAFITNLDFMWKKITDTYEYEMYMIGRGYDVDNSKHQYNLNRFASAIVDFRDFVKDPFVGRGVNKKYRYMGHSNTARANGFTDMLVSFGVLGFGFYIISMWLSFKRISEYYRIGAHYVPVFAIFLLSLSEPLLYTPIFFAFQFAYAKYRPLKTKPRPQVMQPYNPGPSEHMAPPQTAGAF